GALVRFPPPLVFLLSMGAGVGLQMVQPLRITALGVRFSGVAVMLAGLALIAVAFRLFRKSGQEPAPWEPTPSLAFAGPYRFTRNPMYVGMTSIPLGVGLLLGNLWIGGLALLSLFVVHFIAVRPEEAYLTERFGEPYRAYLRRVRRYL